MNPSLAWPRNLRPLAAAGLLLLVFGHGESRAEYRHVPALANVKTTISNGCRSIEETALAARDAGIEALLFGDHLLRELEYGDPPLRNLLVRKRWQLPGILGHGAASYLQTIDNAAVRFSDMTLVPGADVAPFYFWTGKFADQTLTANGWNKRIFLTGLNTPEKFLLPILGAPAEFGPQGNLAKEFALWATGFAACLVLFVLRKMRLLAAPAAIACILLAWNAQPFRPTPYDPYHGDAGLRPAEHLLRYAQARGALSFWSDLESAAPWKSEDLLASANAVPHGEDIVLSSGYTGFEALAPAPIAAVRPGGEWDHVLTEYLRSARPRPAWALGGGSTCPGNGGDALTVLLTEDAAAPALLQTLAAGRFYAVQTQPGLPYLRLDTFSVSDPDLFAAEKKAVSGEELATLRTPRIDIRISAGNGKEDIDIKLVRNGKIVKIERSTLPYRLAWNDESVLRQGRAFYRLLATTADGRNLVSNPVFVRFSSQPPEQKPPATEIAKAPSPAPPAPLPPAAPPPAATAPAADVTRLVIQASAASLRNGPGADFTELIALRKGETVTLLHTSDVEQDGKPWLLVQYKHLRGFLWSAETRPAN